MTSTNSISGFGGEQPLFSFDISVLEMLGMGSLDALGQHAAEGLLRIATEENERNGSE